MPENNLPYARSDKGSTRSDNSPTSAGLEKSQINVRATETQNSAINAAGRDVEVINNYFFGKTDAVSTSAGAAKNYPNGILIVTVTKVEALAVLEVFSQAAGHKWARQVVGDKTYYDLGTHGGASTFMVQSEMGTATPAGALLTVHQAIADLHPQAIVMCGIAFGLRPDMQRLGDILVARQLEYYEPQKVDSRHGQMPRGDRTMSSERLLDRFRSGELDWQGAAIHFGLILSGEKLVNDPAFRDWLLKIEPEAIGGEMEGAGLYAAARDAKVDWILVKAICDWADGEKNGDTQPLAARNAAQFVWHVLQLGGWNVPEHPRHEASREGRSNSYRYDVYSPYESGVAELLRRLTSEHPMYGDALVYQQRLSENLRRARRYGSTNSLESERAEIIDHLNELTLAVLTISFNELSQRP